jgi:hypothetical protein
MGYSIIETSRVKFEDGTFYARVTILVDTESAIPAPEDNWAAGSMCMIADTHTYKVLNNEMEWV